VGSLRWCVEVSRVSEQSRSGNVRSLPALSFDQALNHIGLFCGYHEFSVDDGTVFLHKSAAITKEARLILAQHLQSIPPNPPSSISATRTLPPPNPSCRSCYIR